MFRTRRTLVEGRAYGWTWLEQLAQDLRFGARTLLRNPGFAATAVLTLALSTGATTAIFSIVNGVLLRPLPFADPDRLVQVYGGNWRDDRGGRSLSSASCRTRFSFHTTRLQGCQERCPNRAPTCGCRGPRCGRLPRGRCGKVASA